MVTPVCIHDDTVTFTQAYHEMKTVTTVTCNECGAALYERETTIDATGQAKSNTIFLDDTYELLYTKKGRRRLVAEALTARGYPMPKFWDV